MTETTDQDPKDSLSKETDAETHPAGEKETKARDGDATGATEDADDTEGMDVKAKALMHLLKTSSVSCSYCVTVLLEPIANPPPSLGLRCHHVRKDEETAGRS
jgi:hypothetical protein